MAKHKNYGKVDHINSDKIACVGFFHNFHPEHHHREGMRKFCVEYIKNENNTEVQLAIFPRQISAGKGLAKTTTRAVVCEVSEDHAQLVTNALMRCSFEQYTEVKFIPFTKFDSTYTQMLCKIIDAHRKFLHDVEIIRIPRMQLTHDKMEWKTNKYSSVRDLILASNGTDDAFLRDVDIGTNSSVNILYYISQEEKLPPFLAKLQQTLCDNIQFQALQLIYSYQGSLPALLKRRRVSQFEKDYLNQLRDEFDISNPQDSQPPPKPNPPSNPWVQQTTPNNEANNITELTKRLQTIESTMDGIKNNPPLPTNTAVPNPPDVNALIETQVNAATSALRSEFETKFTNINSKVDAVETSVTTVKESTSKIESSIKKLEETQTKLESTNSRLLVFLEKNYQFPASGPDEEPRANE